MSEMLKLSIFNPVDHMTTEDEIIEYLVDCYFDDPTGQTYRRACEFFGASKKDWTMSASVLYKATRMIAKKEVELEKQARLSQQLMHA